MTSNNRILATLDVIELIHRLPDTVTLTTAETVVFLRRSVGTLEAMLGACRRASSARKSRKGSRDDRADSEANTLS